MHDRLVHPRIRRLRAQIEQSGEAVLKPRELNLLCRGQRLEEQQWNTIAEIAMSEGWSFTFFPDDTVRFAKF